MNSSGHCPGKNPAAGCQTSDDKTSQSRKITLLVVDDDALVRGMMRDVLESEGYRVLEARDGHDALLIGNGPASHVNLLVTSVALPHMTGTELFKQLAPLQPGLKVIFISGHLFTDLQSRGLVIHESEFLGKPFSLERLLEKVRRSLEDV